MLKLSLITPSLNQAAFVAKSLRSVSAQRVRPHEHIIFDAGSTDGTLPILHAYAAQNPTVTVYVGRDRSQTHAINLGFGECGGDVIAWLNTDDFLSSPHVFEWVLAAFAANPDIDVVYGRGRFVDVNGTYLRDAYINTDADELPRLLATSVGILQPATFMRRRIFERVGPLNENLHFCFDYEYWIRIAQADGTFIFVDEHLCDATLHADSKTMGQRVRSLTETVEMVRERYGFAPVEWLERLADATVNNADGILRASGEKTEALAAESDALFSEYNRTNDCISKLADFIGARETIKTADSLWRLRIKRDTFVVTAFDSKFFESGLTLISHLKRFAERRFVLFAFDLGMSERERAILHSIDDVHVLTFPRNDPKYFEGYFSRKTYGFKSYAAWRIGEIVPPGTTVLWIDAGIAPIRSMAKIWSAITADDVFFVDHDDKKIWPFYNINFCTDECVRAMTASNDELLAVHIRAGIFGFKAGGRYRELLRENYRISLIQAAISGEKHPGPDASSPLTPSDQEMRKRLLADARARSVFPSARLRELFKFYGHRHDQTILSLLAARYGAPVKSAIEFCAADDASSDASMKNWRGAAGTAAADPKINAYYLESGVICMQHRGTYINYDDLNIDISEEKAPRVAAKGLAEGDVASISAQNIRTGSVVRTSSISFASGEENMSVTAPRSAAYGSIDETAIKTEFARFPRVISRPAADPPVISIVTPNYNTADFIERTLRSVIDQGYPRLQYVVVDAASTDGSQEIIEKYRNKLHGYICEPDKGHADALNKGFALTSGEIMCWINSDDVLLPGSLAAVAEFFANYPEADWMTGRPSVIEEDGTWKLHNLRKWSRLRYLCGNYRWLQQESTFWRRSLWERAGGALTRDVDLAIDFDLWVRFFRHAEIYTYHTPLGAFRFREGQRSAAHREKYEAEALAIINREAGSLDGEFRRVFQALLPERVRALEYQEVGLRERQLRICDTSTIEPDDLAKRAEAPRLACNAVTPPKRRDTEEYLLQCDDFTSLKGAYLGRRCFVMGNGPSLNKMDLSKLQGEYVFGCNSVFLLFDRIKWRPTFYTCVDSRVLPDRAVEIDAMLAANPNILSFFPNQIRDHVNGRRCPAKTIIPPGPKRHFFREKANSLRDLPDSMFSRDINEYVVQPYTVAITMLQIAAYMGFSEIYLIGCDTSYTVPKDTIKEGIKEDGEIGLALTSVADNDPNHFDSRYFGAGRKWHDPQPHMMIMHHQHAKAALDALGIRAFNATVGGNLEVYPRKDFDSLFFGNEVDLKPVKEALADLSGVPEKRFALAQEAQQSTFNRVDIRKNRPESMQTGADAILKPDPGSDEAPQTWRAHVDETAVVSKLMGERRGREHVMLDVGAHFGSSAAYFDRLGWTIHCFEPDPANREKLVARFGAAENITIDARAVGEKPAAGVSFYSSEESTGISSLGAFRDSHHESAKVDVTTVADIVRARKIARIDFLKIDVEGFDLSVLKGVPWETLQPEVVECEFEDAKTVPLGHSWTDIAGFLRNQGYTVYISEWHPIVRYGIRHDWRRVVPLDGAVIPVNAWGNILAFKEDPGLSKIRGAFASMIKFHPSSDTQTGEAAPARPASPAASETAPAQPAPVATRRFYGPLADQVNRRAPQLFTLLRFVKKTLGGLWRRREFTLPAVVIFAAWLGAGLAPVLTPWRSLIWGSAAFAFLAVALAFVALRVRQFTEALSAENATLRRDLAAVSAAAAHNNALESSLAALSKAAAAREAASSRQMNGELRTLRGAVDAQGQRVNSLDQAIAALETRMIATGEQSANGLAALRAHVAADFEAASAQSAKELTALRADISADIGAASAQSAKELMALRADLGAFNQRYGGIDEAIAALDERIRESDALAKSATETAQRAAAEAPPNNAALYQRFNRRLTARHFEEIEKEWRRRLSVDITLSTLGYLANRACEIEASLEGRLATSIEDVLLRTLVAMSVKRTAVELLEIGTLFGIGAAIMHDALTPRFQHVHLTLLDPLDGYYGASQKDILTGQPVDEPTLRRNLRRAGIPDEDVTLVKRMSTELEAMEEVGRRRYDVLVIDGDHSYAGVKTDFDNYARFLRVGGYVIFDDYGAPEWPDVARFVDAEVAGRAEFAPVAASWRTCVYRATGPASSTK